MNNITDKKLSKKEIKELTKHLRKINVFPHVKYKQIIFEDIYYPYTISSYGDVYALHYKGILNNFHKVSEAVGSNGYAHVTISLYGKNPRTVSVHRLVANAFIENSDPENKIQVNHKNGKKLKNNVRNLEWVTGSENLKHAYKKKLAHSPCGENSGLSKYSNEQIRKACSLLEDNKPLKEIFEKTGVSCQMLIYIRSGKLWKSISKDYNFKGYSKPSKDSKKYKKKLHKVCKMLEKDKYTIKEISEKTGIKTSTIYDILDESYHTNISSKYKISNFKKGKPRKIY